MKRNIFSFLKFYILTASMLMVSCSDFFDQDSDSIVFSEKDHLSNWSDSVYSVVGILNKLQAVADRTILLGEVRADLVTITSDADADLRDLANFNANDDNVYNQPRDYYAIINNCNYYIKHVDSLLKNNRGEYVFMKEFAAIKAIRAWTYLQLVLNYGSVPFYTEPILTKDEAEYDYPRYELADICNYFLNDLSTLPAEYDRSYPGLNHSKFPVSDSRMVFFPLNLLRGELNLWAGNYRDAAKCYYDYLTDRYGTNSAYPTGTDMFMWRAGSTTWTYPQEWGNFKVAQSEWTFWDESYGSKGSAKEFITIIPSNSQRAKGNYSELYNLYNSTSENNMKFSITPSKRMKELSAAQKNCCLNSNGTEVVSPPSGLNYNLDGDLRLGMMWTEGEASDALTGERVETQTLWKFRTKNVHIYRRQMVYLRMAEALNLAGYPHIAFDILSTGLNNSVMYQEMMDHYDTPEDVEFLSYFSFPNTYYELVTRDDIINGTTDHNTIGIHTRGSGWTPMNEDYMIPNDTIEVDEAKRQQLFAEHQSYVDSLIVNETALEFCFEGTRYYDLMRYALRQSNPEKVMADFIYARRGADKRVEVEGELNGKLADRRNWFLRWKDKIGY